MRLPTTLKEELDSKLHLEISTGRTEFRESESLRVQLNNGFASDDTTHVSEKIVRRYIMPLSYSLSIIIYGIILYYIVSLIIIFLNVEA